MGRVHALTGDTNLCQRLRELGFGESALVTKVSGNGPFLCQVNGARFALSHGAAAQIVVMPISAREFTFNRPQPRREWS